MLDMKKYNEWFEWINLSKFCKLYYTKWWYSRLNDVLSWKSKPSKKTLYLLQEAMISFQDDKFEKLNKCLEKPKNKSK